jgi:plasmid stabilization system protein ParE
MQRSLDASAAFIAAVYQAFDTVSAAPHRWPKDLHGTRRFLLHRFPLDIVYLDDPGGVSIVAVALSDAFDFDLLLIRRMTRLTSYTAMAPG